MFSSPTGEELKERVVIKETQESNKLYLSKKAFTLAEVLITLVIIGIIAAITVPMIHANYQKQATVSKLKKAYANLANAIRFSELDNGPLKDWDFPNLTPTGTSTPSAYMEKYFFPYMKINKYSRQYTTYDIKSIDGNDADLVDGNWYNLSDGTSMTFYKDYTQSSFWIFIDLNSTAQPNKLGRDVFMFNIYKKDKPEFWGQQEKDISKLTNDSNYLCKKGTGKRFAGGYCGALIFMNGWEITDDYPW